MGIIDYLLSNNDPVACAYVPIWFYYWDGWLKREVLLLLKRPP